MLEILVATNNLGKLKEYKEILSQFDIKLFSLNDINIKSEPIEDGKSFKENAFIKANDILGKTNKIILADDSGIIIDALGKNYPGIYSKRYAMEFGGHDKCNEYLSKNYLSSKARFICVLCILNLKDEPLYFEGKCEGNITNISNTNNGFGYDPIFKPNGYNKTFGELTSEIKNKISHRAKATLSFVEYLKQNNII